MIKRFVSKRCGPALLRRQWLNDSKKKRNESTIWQRRYWEHMIRDEDDFRRHIDYLHFNPVKHGLVQRTEDWPFSTFHRYVNDGVYSEGWGNVDEEQVEDEFGEPADTL